MTHLKALQKTLKVRFRHPALLEQALVHSSYANENPTLAPASNERLEFLGDAVLGFVIAEELYKRFPQFSEGEMTRLRSALVQRDALAGTAKAIKLGDYLYLGRGEEASGGRLKLANLSGALEAIIAAIFLDRGLATARDFILRTTRQQLEEVPSRGVEADYKSRLQEIIQSRQQPMPSYKVVEATGPAHRRRFTVEVRVGKKALGRGSGKSKNAAETEAARTALEKL
jgi:ribonuclease-3